MRTKDIEVSLSGAVAALVVFLCLGAGLALLLAGPRQPIDKGPGRQAAPVVTREILRAPPADFAVGFAPVARRALPAVVNISSTRIVKGWGGGPAFFFGDPLFQQFFGNLFRESPVIPRERRDQSRGSGVIVRADGILLTNSHVVEGASEVRVVLSDKRQFSATVKGADPRSDIAVLQIDARDLPTLPVGDSAKLEIGNFVLAIGDPFGIGQTVTLGIVSAVGRGHLDLEDYEDFIQTDAAINPGNSGGALIDVQGNLVGLNTAILSSLGGGNQGIGFAVPSNMASHVLDEILQHGKVIRGYLGVGIQDVTPGIARAFQVSSPQGALVSDVQPGGPADRGGLRRGDVILKLDGSTISDASVLRLRVAQLAPQTHVRLRVLRDGSERDISLLLGEMPAQSPGPGLEKPKGQEAASGVLSGVRAAELTPELSEELGGARSTPASGIVVVAVPPGSAAAEAGLQRGDLVQEVNRQPIRSLRDFERAARAAGDSALLLVKRANQSLFLYVSSGR